jgi:hypothetical protein
MSTDSIHPGKWRLALLMLIFTLIGGAVLVTLLALGLGDPPSAGELAWQTKTDQDWQRHRDFGETVLTIAPVRLPEAPFTLELQASNHGVSDSAWGMWIETTAGIWTMLVSNEGYMSVSNDEQPHWAGFIHIRSETNKVYLHVEGDHMATVRINDEIAWRGRLATESEWGIARFRRPDLGWDGDVWTGG